MIFNALELTIPLLFAALGGMFSKKAGILNISLEGMIICGAFLSYAAAETSSSLILGIMAGMVMGALMALLFALGSLVLKGNIYMVGLAINLSAYPLTKGLSHWIFGHGGTLRAQNFIPPVRWGDSSFGIGLLMGHNFFLPLALILTLAVWYFFRNSPTAYKIELAGGSPQRLREKGSSPEKVRLSALLISGALCGLSGAALSLPLGSYVTSMSAGKGWIALVLIYLGSRNIWLLLAGSFLFALLESLVIKTQGWSDISPSLLQGIPYLLILAIFAIAQYRKQKP